MGYICHHAILVTTYSTERMQPLVEAVAGIFQPSSFAGPFESPVNGYLTLLILPDGSKEGWDESDLGNDRRDELIEWMESQRFSDGSGPYAWAEVQYGDESDDNEMTRCSEMSDGREEPEE